MPSPAASFLAQLDPFPGKIFPCFLIYTVQTLELIVNTLITSFMTKVRKQIIVIITTLIITVIVITITIIIIIIIIIIITIIIIIIIIITIIIIIKINCALFKYWENVQYRMNLLRFQGRWTPLSFRWCLDKNASGCEP